jgi:hypothetical protein
VLEAVEHRPQQVGLQVAEAPLALEQVLVAHGDVLGADRRDGGDDEVFASRRCSVLTVTRLMRSRPFGLIGVVADDEPGVLAVDADLFDP